MADDQIPDCSNFLSHNIIYEDGDNYFNFFLEKQDAYFLYFTLLEKGLNDDEAGSWSENSPQSPWQPSGWQISCTQQSPRAPPAAADK